MFMFLFLYYFLSFINLFAYSVLCIYYIETLTIDRGGAGQILSTSRVRLCDLLASLALIVHTSIRKSKNDFK